MRPVDTWFTIRVRERINRQREHVCYGCFCKRKTKKRKEYNRLKERGGDDGDDVCISRVLVRLFIH